MTESTWHAWCPVHKIMVGLAPDPSNPSSRVHRFSEVSMLCACPDDKLEIRRYDEPPDWRLEKKS